jgi:phosphoribosylanthranilate isomerase
MIDFQIKICGVTNVSNAVEVADAGADCIGLNFYPKSRRYVDPQQAVKIAGAVRSRVRIVGLFVNESEAMIRSLHESIGFDYVQLHGDEAPTLFSKASLPPTIRAFKWPAHDQQQRDFIQSWIDQTRLRLAACLVDANVESSYGGTGHVTQWSTLNHRPVELRGLPLILAGGLTSHNVAQGVIETKADAVDAASGVESEPGIKDPEQVQAFVRAARAAYLQITSETQP